MKRLPITKEQRRRIEYRARMAEQNRCIRIVREELLGNVARDNVARDIVGQVVKAIILRKETPSGSAGER